MLFTVGCNTTPIQASPDNPVVDRVASLERQVLNLTSRVLQLEKQQASQSAKKPVAPVISNVPTGKTPWRKLQRGMNKNQVRALLGEPVKINQYGSFEFWHYEKFSKVEFDFDGYVRSWHEP